MSFSVQIRLKEYGVELNVLPETNATTHFSIYAAQCNQHLIQLQLMMSGNTSEHLETIWKPISRNWE